MARGTETIHVVQSDEGDGNRVRGDGHRSRLTTYVFVQVPTLPGHWYRCKPAVLAWCPKCGADPGKPCRNATRHLSTCHQDRWRRYRSERPRIEADGW